jgi:hypothetical protein
MSNEIYVYVGIQFQVAAVIFLFANMSRPAAGTFHLPVKQVLGTP